jgi:hypothetical protein
MSSGSAAEPLIVNSSFLKTFEGAREITGAGLRSVTLIFRVATTYVVPSLIAITLTRNSPSMGKLRLLAKLALLSEFDEEIGADPSLKNQTRARIGPLPACTVTGNSTGSPTSTSTRFDSREISGGVNSVQFGSVQFGSA